MKFFRFLKNLLFGWVDARSIKDDAITWSIILVAVALITTVVSAIGWIAIAFDVPRIIKMNPNGADNVLVVGMVMIAIVAIVAWVGIATVATVKHCIKVWKNS